MEETDEQYAARLGLEPPSDPVLAEEWWRALRFYGRDQWSPGIAFQLKQGLGAHRELRINRILSASS